MPKIPNTTQSFIPIKDIKDGVVIMKDGSLRLVLITSSINFALRSSDEQIGILHQYQSLLNSLDFSMQIFVQSRRLDINPYLATLEKRLSEEKENDLLRIQIQEYIHFVRAFTEDTRIMEKRFFVILAYNPPIAEDPKTLAQSFFRKGKEKDDADLARQEGGRIQLEQRASIVEQGLARTGITSERLSTEGLLELFFKVFNPGDTSRPFAPNPEYAPL
jgi:type IV secretory pathway VirB4 component